MIRRRSALHGRVDVILLLGKLPPAARLEGGTDAASMLIFDPAALPEDYDCRARHDPITVIGGSTLTWGRARSFRSEFIALLSTRWITIWASARQKSATGDLDIRAEPCRFQIPCLFVKPSSFASTEAHFGCSDSQP